jgi:hypothetical protein
MYDVKKRFYLNLKVCKEFFKKLVEKCLNCFLKITFQNKNMKLWEHFRFLKLLMLRYIELFTCLFILA